MKKKIIGKESISGVNCKCCQDSLKTNTRLCLLCRQHIKTKHWEKHIASCEKEYRRARPWLDIP